MEAAKKVVRVWKRSSRSVREFTRLSVILHAPRGIMEVGEQLLATAAAEFRLVKICL